MRAMDPQEQLEPVASSSLDEVKSQLLTNNVSLNSEGEGNSNVEQCTTDMISDNNIPQVNVNDINGNVNNSNTVEIEQMHSAKFIASEQLDKSLIIESDEEINQDNDSHKSNSVVSSEKLVSDDSTPKKSLREVSQASTVDIRDLGEVSQATTVDVRELDGNMPPSPEDLFASQSTCDLVKHPSENSFMEYEDFIPSSLPSQNVKRINEMEDSVDNVSTQRKRKLEDIDEECNENKVPRMQTPADIPGNENNWEHSKTKEKDSANNKPIVSDDLPGNNAIPTVSVNGEKFEKSEENLENFKEPKSLIKDNVSKGESSKEINAAKDPRKSVEIVFLSVENSRPKDILNECSQDILSSVPEENGEDSIEEADGEHMYLHMSLSPTQATPLNSETDLSGREHDVDIKHGLLKTKSTEISSNGHNDVSSTSNYQKYEACDDSPIKNDSISVHETSDIQIISPDAEKAVPNDTVPNTSDNNSNLKLVPETNDDIVILDENNDTSTVTCSIKHKDMNGSLVNKILHKTEDNSGKQELNNTDKLEAVVDGEVVKQPQLSNLSLNDRSTPDLPLLLPNKDNTSLRLREIDIAFAPLLKCRVQVTEESRQVQSIEIYQCNDSEDVSLSNLNHQESSSGYAADESKNSSPSSVVSVGPFALKTQLCRFSSSSTSTVSSGHSGIGARSRNADWRFVAPLKPAPSRNFRGHNVHYSYSTEFEKDLLVLVEKKIYVDDDLKLPSAKKILPVVPSTSSSTPPKEEMEGLKEISKNKIELAEQVPETPKSTKKLRDIRITRTASRNLVSKIKEVKEEEEPSPQPSSEKDTAETPNSHRRPRKTPLRSSKRTANNTPSTPVAPEDPKITASSGSISRSRRNRTEPIQNEKVDSSSHESSHVYEWEAEGCFSKLVPEAPVFARWTDKRYYPGRIKEKTKDGRWIVEFDDKTVRPLKDEFIIPINILTKGQIVFAFEEEEYEQGIIVEFKLKGGEVLYGVELDSGKKSFYPRSKLFMSEDQARLLQENIDPKSPTTSSPALTIVSCDNIVHHKRPRSNRVLFGAAESPSVSGVLKTPKRSGKVDPSHDTSCSSSVSDINDKGAPLILEEVSGVDPEVPSYFPESLPASAGRGKGPGRIKSKTRTPRRNASNHSLNEENNQLYKILGPIPEEGSKMFSGMCFLLTHSGIKSRDSLKNSLSSKSAKNSEQLTGSENEEVSTDEGIGSCHIPFVKEHLKKQIEAGEGIVFEHFEDLPEDQYQNTFLVADRPSLTAKFILCLASGIRIIHHPWIVEEVKGSGRPWTGARLHAGWDIEGRRYIAPEATVRTRKQKPLNRKEVGLVNDSQTFVKFWGRILELLGASVRHITPEQDREFSGVDVIVTDSSCPPEVQERAREWSIPLVSPIWVTQSLINWRIRSYSGHPHYRYDYCASE